MIIDFHNRGGGGGGMSNYYTKEQVNALIQDFVTATTTDLVNYYLKSETYTQTEVDNLIGSIEGFHYEIAPSTASVVDPQGNVLYLIGPSGSGNDQYEEYVYANSTWTKIGDTSIDLSNYVTVNQLNTALGFYTTTLQLDLLLQGKQDVLTPGTGITISSNVISADIPDIPQLATVATTGEYNDLTGRLTAGDRISISTQNVISADSQVITLTQQEYDALGTNIDPDVIYIISDAAVITLSTVATTGSYNDLTDKPSIPEIPTLATVATTGSYDDLTGTPSIPDAVSGVNDGTNWTSITIGTTTAAIPAGGGGNAKERLDITQMTQSERAALFMQLYTGDYTTPNTYDIYVQAYPVTSIKAIDCNFSRGIQFTYNVIITQCYDSANDKYINFAMGDALFLAQDGTYTTDHFTAPYELGELGNVKASSPNDGDVLSYDSASGFWISTQVPVPALATVATTGAYSDLTGTPTLSTVASSGSYDDLTDKPDIPYIVYIAYDTYSEAYTCSATAEELHNNLVVSSKKPLFYYKGTPDSSELFIPLSIRAYEGESSDISTSYGEIHLYNHYWYAKSEFTLTWEYGTGSNFVTVVYDGYHDERSDWNESNENSESYIRNRPTLSTVATTGSYNDLTNQPAIPDAVSGVNDGTNWTSLTIGTDTYAIPQGGSSAKTELMTLSLQEQLAFYQATLAGTMKDFSQYTANGYPLINAYPINAGVVIDVDGSTYTTDGTEVALLMNQRAYLDDSEEYVNIIHQYLTLFSPTIVQTYGATIDLTPNIYGNIKPDWNAQSGNDNEILNKPTLSTVATSGSYNDLTDKPSIPTLSTVASSGSYDDLTDKPDIPYLVYITYDAYGNAYTCSATAEELHENLAVSHKKPLFYYKGAIDDTDMFTPMEVQSYEAWSSSGGNESAGEAELFYCYGLDKNRYLLRWEYANGSGTVTVTNRGSIDARPNWNETNAFSESYIRNRPTLSTVATTGSYNDLTGKLTAGSKITIGTNNVISAESETVVELTQAQYDAISTKDEHTLYIIKDAVPIDMNDYVLGSELSTVATSGSYNDLLNKPSITAVSGTNDGTNWTSLTVGTDTYAIPQGGGSKIELLELTPQEQYQFYTDVMEGNIIDFSSYTANGYPVVNAYQFNEGWVVDDGEDGYTTDGSEVAIIMNPVIEAVGTRQHGDYNSRKYLDYYITLFSPDIVQAYEGTLDLGIQMQSNVQGDWNESDSDSGAFIKNKPVLSTVATSGSYNDLSDTLTAGTGITIGTDNVISAAGGNAWYGSQYQFDTLGTYDADTDYFISDKIPYSEISGTPDLSSYATKADKSELEVEIAGKMDNIVFLGTGGLATIGTPLEGVTYAIEGQTLPLTFTLDGIGTVTYNFVID